MRLAGFFGQDEVYKNKNKILPRESESLGLVLRRLGLPRPGRSGVNAVQGGDPALVVEGAGEVDGGEGAVRAASLRGIGLAVAAGRHHPGV